MPPVGQRDEPPAKTYMRIKAPLQNDGSELLGGKAVSLTKTLGKGLGAHRGYQSSFWAIPPSYAIFAWAKYAQSAQTPPICSTALRHRPEIASAPPAAPAQRKP
jgi:hypothetical protein